MKKGIIWTLVIVLFYSLGFWTALQWLGSNHTSAPESVSQFIAPVSLPTPEDMQTKLMDPGVDLHGRETLMEKIDIQKRLEGIQETGKNNPAPKDSAANPAPAAMVASVPVETGIFEGSEGMVHPDQGAIQNYWRGVVKGKIVMVMAGAKAGDNNQGLVIVLTASTDPSDNSISIEYYLAPVRSGSLRVVSEKNHRIELQTTQGAKIGFNWEKRAFVQ